MRISDLSSDVCSSDLQSFAHTGGSHADAIQIFTTHATGSSDVLIESNRILQKDGTPMQGILISSQNQSRHSNITVRNNLVLTSDMPLGIAVYASDGVTITGRSEEHTSELQSLIRISYAVLGL